MITTIIEAFNFSFFQRAILIGSLLAITYALLGTFVVIKRQSIIGHSIANLSFFGLALGLVLSWNVNITILISAIIGACIIAKLTDSEYFSQDSLLAFIAESSIAAAIIAISQLQGYRVDINQYLFGSIIALSKEDIFFSGLLAIVVISLIYFFKQKLLQIVFNEDLAKASGTNIKKINFLYIMLIALSISIGVKIIGIILISAFLIIPANTAKLFAQNFKQMLIYSSVFAVTGTIVGLILSYLIDTPSGAMIIVVLGGQLILSICIKHIPYKE